MGCVASRPDCDDEGPETPHNGTWTKYSNIDMCAQGDVQIIGGWRSKHSIAEMKRIVEQNNWSAICVGSFGHAALKNFDFQLRQHHCKPSRGYTCALFVFTPPPHKAKPEGGPKPKLVLVGTNDPRRITLANAAAIAAGQQAPLTLASHPGYAICRDFPERRTAFHEWDYTALAVGPAAQAVTCALVGQQLVEGSTRGVITPSMLKLGHNNHFDFVWHKHNHPARLHQEAGKHAHRPLDVRIDPSSGAIMPATRGDLCYGLEFAELPPLPAQPMAAQPMMAQPMAQPVAAQPMAGFAQPMAGPVVVQGTVVQGEAAPPMGLPVSAGSPNSAVPVASASGKGAAGAPPLHTMVEIFKRQLGLDMKLNMQEVVDQACAQLGVDATQSNLVEKAQTCWEMLGCPSS